MFCSSFSELHPNHIFGVKVNLRDGHPAVVPYSMFFGKSVITQAKSDIYVTHHIYHMIYVRVEHCSTFDIHTVTSFFWSLTWLGLKEIAQCSGTLTMNGLKADSQIPNGWTNGS